MTVLSQDKFISFSLQVLKSNSILVFWITTLSFFLSLISLLSLLLNRNQKLIYFIIEFFRANSFVGFMIIIIVVAFSVLFLKKEKYKNYKKKYPVSNKLKHPINY